jgi:hypothetical protein
MNNGRMISDKTRMDGNSETRRHVIESRCSVVNVTNSSFCGSIKIKPLSDVLKQTIACLVSGNSIITYPHLYPLLRALFMKSLEKLTQV